MLRVLEFCEKTIVAYGKALVDAGADILAIAEPAVSQLSRQAYERYSRPYSERIILALKKLFILHVCGKTDHLIDSICESGWAGISIEYWLQCETSTGCE